MRKIASGTYLVALVLGALALASCEAGGMSSAAGADDSAADGESDADSDADGDMDGD